MSDTSFGITGFCYMKSSTENFRSPRTSPVTEEWLQLCEESIEDEPRLRRSLPIGFLLVCGIGGMCVDGVGNLWKTWRLLQLTWVVWNLCVSHECHRRLRTSKGEDFFGFASSTLEGWGNRNMIHSLVSRRRVVHPTWERFNMHGWTVMI